MAYIKKYEKGYRAQIFLLGIREAKSFRTRREAEAWAGQRETEIRDQSTKHPKDKHTLKQALFKYRDEVTPHKRGAKWERVRLEAFESTGLDVTLAIGKITPEMLGKWRDHRLKSVSAGTVLREMSLLSAMFEVARREWRWVEVNPVRDVRKPRSPDHRDIVLTRRQIRAMLVQLGYSPLKRPMTISQSVAVCMLLALRSGMRAGELCGLTWDRVFDGYCQLPVTKTVPRDVPLSAKAMRIIRKMRGFDETLVFGVKSQTLDALFRRARDRAGLSGFVFHDTRHTAATWMAGKVDVLTLCKVFGWARTDQALTYFNPKAADIARML